MLGLKLIYGGKRGPGVFITLESMIVVGHGFKCKFEDPYICGYTAKGLQFVWMRVEGWYIKDGIGPTSDHTGSVLGKVNIIIDNEARLVYWNISSQYNII